MNIIETLIKNKADARTIDTIQKFLRSCQGKPATYSCYNGFGEVKFFNYENAQIEYEERKGVVLIALTSDNTDLYYAIEKV